MCIRDSSKPITLNIHSDANMDEIMKSLDPYLYKG